MEKIKMNVEQFKRMYGDGYKFLYCLCNQGEEFEHNICMNWYISDARIIFTEVRAHRGSPSPTTDCIMFLDEYGNKLTFESARIEVWEHESESWFAFDIICGDTLSSRFPAKKYLFTAQKI